MKKTVNKNADAGITADGVYRMLLQYAAAFNIDVSGFGPHALRATAATNALDHNADIAKVQRWLGHASFATTRIYDRRTLRSEDSPTFKVAYLYRLIVKVLWTVSMRWTCQKMRKLFLRVLEKRMLTARLRYTKC